MAAVVGIWSAFGLEGYGAGPSASTAKAALLEKTGDYPTGAVADQPVKVDVSKTREPISKYIYGQFIEHLGRCIYGGIWAEMLEDRKFYYAVGGGKSPWEATGNGGVVMVREDSFVGEQTPRIPPGSGIRQATLGLIKAKRYAGYIWLKPLGDSTTLEVSLQWGDGPGQIDRRTVTSRTKQYGKCRFEFTSGGNTDEGIFETKVTGGSSALVGTVSLMPADNVQGMRADTLRLLKELNAPIYRWPGGNFVSGYDWQDGVGPRDRRPPRRNLAWNSLESNDFGIDEFMTFCRLVGAEPLIVVNSGFGDAHSAAQQIEYVNGSPDTPMGKWRAANGRPEPYNVKWWGIGNEMYGRWQLGHMSLDHYAIKHNLFARALRRVDPSVKLIAVGNAGPWSEGMLKNCAGYMDLISEHFYCKQKEPLLAHCRQIAEAVRAKVAAHRDYRKRLPSLRGKDIDIAIDEWNYWYGPPVYGEFATRYYLKDALGVAAGLHEMIRNSDIVFMANYAQTVNVLGAIKTTKTAAAFETTGLVLKMYRNYFGQVPVEVTGVEQPLDVAAALTGDGRGLIIAVVNPTHKELTLPLEVKGARLTTGGGRRWHIDEADPMAHNEPGKDPGVKIVETNFCDGMVNVLEIPALSVSIYELRLE